MLVVGMHRSGTSAVTRALSELGLDLGGDPLMSATEANPTGHYEVGRLMAINDELLDAVGGRWSAPPAAGPDEVAALVETELAPRARRQIDQVFAGDGWVWKDPRTSLLLPFWRSVLDPEPAIVAVLRHPIEVARSLEARDGMAVDYGLALWERYTRVLLRDLVGLPVYLVEYEATIDGPDAVLAGLADFVAANERLESPPDRAGAAGAFVGDHRHQRATAADLDAEPAATAELIELHQRAGEFVGHHDSFPVVDLGPESAGLQVAFTEHKRLSSFEESAPFLQADLDLARSRIGDLKLEIERRSEQASNLASEVLGLREEVEGYRELLPQVVEDRDSLADRLIDLETWWPVLNALRARRILDRCRSSARSRVDRARARFAR